MALRVGCLARHAHLSPFVGVSAGITGLVGIGKDSGHGGWLVLGVKRWHCGLLGYKRQKAKILPVDGADMCGELVSS